MVCIYKYAVPAAPVCVRVRVRVLPISKHARLSLFHQKFSYLNFVYNDGLSFALNHQKRVL